MKIVKTCRIKRNFSYMAERGVVGDVAGGISHAKCAKQHKKKLRALRELGVRHFFGVRGGRKI